MESAFTVRRMRRGAVWLYVVIVLAVAACAGAGSTAETGPASTVPAGPGGEPSVEITIEGAIAVDVATTPSGPVVAWTTHEAVHMAELDLVSGQLRDTRVVSGDLAPVHHPIERPAVVVMGDGSVEVAFVSAVGAGGSVFLSEEGSGPYPISGPERPETNLVHATNDAEGNPVLAWLEDSTLSVAHQEGPELLEIEEADGLTCDCCNPVPVQVGETLMVAYRDRDDHDGETVRNVAVVRSVDGGRSFQDPEPVADSDWAIDGCPFSGPDIVDVDGSAVVAWMDARQSRYPDQDAASIWVDRAAADSGGFGEDVEVASDGGHRWPTLTVDDERVIYLFWETSGPEGGLSYARSDDVGASFSTPEIVVGRRFNDDGAPGSPTATYHDGMVVLTWADSRNGHVAAWSTGS